MHDSHASSSVQFVAAGYFAMRCFNYNEMKPLEIHLGLNLIWVKSLSIYSIDIADGKENY